MMALQRVPWVTSGRHASSFLPVPSRPLGGIPSCLLPSLKSHLTHTFRCRFSTPPSTLAWSTSLPRGHGILHSTAGPVPISDHSCAIPPARSLPSPASVLRSLRAESRGRRLWAGRSSHLRLWHTRSPQSIPSGPKGCLLRARRAKREICRLTRFWRSQARSLHSGAHFTPAAPTLQPTPDMQAAAGLCCLSVSHWHSPNFIFSCTTANLPGASAVVSRLCLEHTSTPASPAVSLILRPPSQPCRSGSQRTNCSRLPAVVECKRSNVPSCEQVQDSCIQSNLISRTPVPRTSLETWTKRPFVPISIRFAELASL
ncbi:uncharacterized protein B0T15DRAFT_136818 [Chaetomium strumarium]|uniref:Uncharacterized protein n=1 Tax=Chaetomium strumarium TaxID=1170767 RepID=A0AAJ0GUA2_9PEZI|nr:hypothetical protein B0T15DRAFT_136818 [Chaetomium strumarium]